MSQQPVWLTDAGSLGTVPEGEYYNISLLAVDPDAPIDPTHITYSLLAGSLPKGVAVYRNGTVEGIPISKADVAGVPSLIDNDITSRFTIRATSNEFRIRDRTFSLTVIGQDNPEFVTPPGLIAEYFDGEEIDILIEIEDNDLGDILKMTLSSGILPPGVVLIEEGPDIGLLTGYIEPIPTVDSQYVGFDATGNEYDEFPYDFGTTTIDKNYQFTLQISDGKSVDLRTFEIFVYSRDGITADNTIITADGTIITTDTINSRQPFLIDYIPNFGTVQHYNFFAYKFDGYDPNFNKLSYNHISGTLPETLTLDKETGWLSGYLIDVGLNEIKYEFQIQLASVPKYEDLDGDDDKSSIATSVIYNFVFTVVGTNGPEINWTTPTDLGYISNGEISTLYVEALYEASSLQYRLKNGLYNKLPQGLLLFPSGNIVGRVSFKMFNLDNGSTTFDADIDTRLEVNQETTWDRTYKFTVEAYSINNNISTSKDFVIHLNKETNTPYNILYAKAMSPAEDRRTINNLLQDKSIFNPESLYRTDDSNFGVSTNVIYEHAYGLSPEALSKYVSAFNLNHYKKNLILGGIRTAKALDDNNKIIYEVVYSNIVDDLTNKKNESVSKEVDLTYGAINHNEGAIIDDIIFDVYPNSLDNMREQVFDNIDQISKILPRWMLSKQENGRILGFTPAWVIAYTKPGESSKIAYNINNQFDQQLNEIDFTLDRFILDDNLSDDWNKCEDDERAITGDNTLIKSDNSIITSDRQNPSYDCSIGWNPGMMTTFDRIQNLLYVTVDNTIITVDSNRYINPHTIYDHIAGWDTNSTPFDILGWDFSSFGVLPVKPDNPYDIESETIFDGGSCRFLSPIDSFNNINSTDTYNKYIMYPQVDITNTILINTES